MNLFKFSIFVILLTGISPKINAYYIITRTGGGPSGYGLITENHGKTYQKDGNTFCVASLSCSGIGTDKPEFIGPFSTCELQDTIAITSGVTRTGTFSEEFNFVCMAAEKSIKGGNTKG